MAEFLLRYKFVSSKTYVKMKSKSKLPYYLYSILLLLILFNFQSCASSKESGIKTKSTEEWTIAKTDKGEDSSWVIYTRKIHGTNFLEYKIEGDVKSTSKACISSFKEDIHKQAIDLKNKKYPTYEIVEESRDSLLTYVIHNEPFPLKNTEMSIMYIFYNNKDGSTGVTWHEAWDESQVQLTKKLNRVEIFRGSWSFIPTSDNSCQAANSVQFDPKGMPLWLVNPMVMKFLKNGLKSIRETSSK